MHESVEKYIVHLNSMKHEYSSALDSIAEAVVFYPDLVAVDLGKGEYYLQSELAVKDCDKFTTRTRYGGHTLYPYVNVGNLRINSFPSEFYFGDDEDYSMPSRLSYGGFNPDFIRSVEKLIVGLNESIKKQKEEEDLEELYALAEKLGKKVVD